MEGSVEQGGRVNVKGWQLHQGSLIENNTAKSQLEWILFKCTPPSLPISQHCEVVEWQSKLHRPGIKCKSGYLQEL